jgi:hypothetical protein
MPDVRVNILPEPMMYGPDEEETEPAVGCDHDYPLDAPEDDRED